VVSVRTFVEGWPVYRQLTGPDPLGRGAAKSGRSARLEPRTGSADKVVKSVCPYCAVGCGQDVYVRDGEVTQIEGDPDSPVSRGRLCPKGSASLQLTTGGARRYQVLYRRPFDQLAKSLGKRSLVMIKSALRRSIRRAQVHNLIGKNVIELIDLPTGQPGHPSRAMTQEQAASVLKTASGKATGYVRVVKASKGRYGATQAATETGYLACGTKPHQDAPITEVSREPKETTCRSCRSQLGIGEADNANLRLEALFVLSITLGLRPGELRQLTWSHVDLNRGVVHVWRSASKTGDTKTAKSKRSLTLPRRAITALKAHKTRQDRERREAGEAWHDNGPRVLPRERRRLDVRRAQLALLQDDQESGHRPLARPRRPTHRSLDHEQQRRTDPRDQRHRRPQVHPRNPRPSTAT
jgi:integrase